MSHPSTDWLGAALIYLAAAVLAVPLAKRLGLGAILGYLIAGIAIGPWGLRLVAEPEAVLQVAEFGVVLMLFLVGLELEPRRLWALRRAVFGWGSVQLLGSTLLLGGLALLCGWTVQVALVGGLALAMSSTAVGLGVLGERNLQGSSGGRAVLALMLAQDIAAIPILALLPLMAGSGGASLKGALIAAGTLAGLVLGGRLLLRPALRWIARANTPEVFSAAALLLVVLAALLMRSVGLSMALGAFVAGVLLAESEYRHELETDLEPFKGLLLGLFFIAVGMSLDFGVLIERPGLVLGMLAALLVLKAALLMGMGRAMKLPAAERPFFVLLLAQGGEFGFVVVQTALGAKLIEGPLGSALLAAIALSMLATPLLLLAVDRFWLPRLSGCKPRLDVPTLEDKAATQLAPVIIAGFGRYGQIVGRVLSAQGLQATVLDHDAEQVEGARKFGWGAYFGDATRLDLLRNAGAAEAKVLVIALDDVEQSETLAALAGEHFPNLTRVARARNVTHYAALRRLGVHHIERETFESAVLSGRSVLELLGLDREQTARLAEVFRQHNIEQLEAMLPHLGDEQRLIAISKQGREQLEALWAAQQAQQKSERPGNP